MPLRPVEIIREAWDLIADQYWLFLGLAFVTVIIGAAAPFGILMGPMMCGMYGCCLAKARGQRVEFGDLFKGFEVFVEALLASLAQMAVVMVVVVLGIFVMMGTAILSGALASADAKAVSVVVIAAASAVFVLLLLVFSVAVALAFGFAFPLIMDRRLKALDAIKASAQAARENLGGLLLLHLCLMAASIVLACMCYIPALLFMPVHFAALTVAYRKIFGDPPKPA